MLFIAQQIGFEAISVPFLFIIVTLDCIIKHAGGRNCFGGPSQLPQLSISGFSLKIIVATYIVLKSKLTSFKIM